MENLKRSRHYEHHVEPPRVKVPETPEDDGRMLCPMSRKPCLRERCIVWDDHWRNCTLNPTGLYNQMRDAMTDAIVDIARAYMGDDLHG